MKLLIIVTTLFVTYSISHAVTTSEEAAVTRDILTLIPTDGNQQRAGILGGFVRLAFHDAGTYDRNNPETSGKSDGCVDLSAPDNAGLSTLIDLLAPVVNRHSLIMSRADIWNLAANTIINFSTPNRGGTLNIPLRYGRIDVADATSACSESDNNKLPNAELSHQHTTAVFVERMGFTQLEITALMGAHTLGRADADASGYDGAWVVSSSTFDNTYYSDILRRPWVRDANENGQHFWRDPNADTIMLNTDMALAFDIGDDATVNLNNCRTGRGGGGQRGNNCPNTAENAETVATFANNQQTWFNEFAKAWVKLQELGYPEGTLSFPEGEPVVVNIPNNGAVGGGPLPRNPNPINNNVMLRVFLSIAACIIVILLLVLWICCCRRNKPAATKELGLHNKTPTLVPSAPLGIRAVESTVIMTSVPVIQIQTV